MSDLPIDGRWAIVLGLVVVLGGILYVSAGTSTQAFSIHNPNWNGSSELASEVTGVVDPRSTTLDSFAPNETVLVLLSPTSSYNETQRNRFRKFVRQGGDLVVAEDSGTHANLLLSDIGARARIDGRPVRDEIYYYESPSMPTARNVSNHPLGRNVDALTLNYGSVVEPNGTTVLARTSPYAYLDANRNGDLDSNESLGSYPVATVEHVGDGRVVVVSDASILINTMLNRPGNHAFVRNLLRGHESKLLGHAPTADAPLLNVILHVVRSSPVLQVLLGLFSLLVVGFWERGLSASEIVRNWRGRQTSPETRRTSEPDAIVEYYARRREDWNVEYLTEVVDRIRDRRE